jgi:hypothetical protein
MCGLKNLKGELTGGFDVNNMDGLMSLNGAEGITSVGSDHHGSSINLGYNPILTSAIALANTEYPTRMTGRDGRTGAFDIKGNPYLTCVPSAWPATDRKDATIPHGSCPKR